MKQDPPPEGGFIAIYFKENKEGPIGYYWLEWNQILVPPKGSFFYNAPPMKVNKLLDRLKGKPNE